MNAMSAKAVGYALAAVAASGALLALVFLGYWSLTGPAEPRDLYVPGKEFRAAVGQARVEGEQLVVSGFEGASPRRQAVLSLRRQLDSEAYRLLTIHMSQLPPGMAATVFWRKSGQALGDALYSQPVPANVAGAATLDMTRNPGWRGPLAEIGLLLAGDPGSRELHFSGLSLVDRGVGPALGSLLTQWTGFHRFDQTSINRLSATFTAGTLSPIPVAAVWAGLALLLVLVAGWLGKAAPRITYLLVVLTVWVSLDLLWQRQLSAQLQLSQQLFQGRSVAERHRRDFDSALYDYAQQLKSGGLPDTPARLFMLHNSQGHNFQRLKLQYYLLPHNIYNLSVLPPEGAVREGDYILALVPVPGLEFHGGRSLLRWDEGAPVSATLEHSHPMGKLFRVAADPAAPPEPVTGARP
ncbi:MAG: hypothetical protein KDI04_09000 [Halieaceae bacterium]|nr:hypothetical protein [Halieaceae bacterium]MCP5147014.1 hypothetical protein [Pseudomonadales bacterium]MCP5165825.1 hypothetical protein [Pseudomonadales bacterium]